MSSTPSDHRRPGRARRIGIVLAVLSATVAVGVYAIRDLPRRLVEAQLASALDADVRLGGLRIEARDRFELLDLEIVAPTASPPYALTVPVARVEGDVRDMVDGSFRRLELEDAILGLQPTPGPPADEEEDEAPAPIIDRLRVPGMKVGVCADVTEPRCPRSVLPDALTADADFTGLGTTPRGRLRVGGPRLELSHRADPDAAPITGRLGDPRLVAELGDGAWILEASAGSLDVTRGDGALRLEAARWQGRSEDSATVITESASIDGGRVERGADAVDLPAIRWTPVDDPESALLRLDMEADLWRAAHVAYGTTERGLELELHLGDADLGRLLALSAGFVEGLPEAAGRLTAELTLTLPSESTAAESEPAAWSLRSTVRPERVASVGFGDGTRLELEARGSGLPGDGEGEVSLSALLPSIHGDGVPEAVDDLPPGLWPLRLDARGTFDAPAESWTVDSFDARTDVGSCAGSARRAPDSPSPAHAAVRWRCSGSLRAALADRAAEPAEITIEDPSPWSARGSLDLEPDRWRAEGRAEASARSVKAADGARAEEPRVAFRFRADPKTVRLRELDGELRLALPGLALPDPAADLPAIRARLRGELGLRLDRPRDGIDLALDTVELTPTGSSSEASSVEEEPAARLRVEARGLPERVDGTVELTVAEPGPWLRWAAPLLPESVQTLETKGGARLEARLTRDDGGPVLEGPLTLTGVGLSDAEGSRVIEGLDVDARLQGRLDESGLRAELEGRAGGFVMLWRTVFSDFSDLETDFRLTLASKAAKAKASQAADDEPPWTATAQIHPLPGPTVDLEADLWPESRSARYELGIDAPDLESFHRRILVPLQDDPPTLLALTGAADLRLRGRLTAPARDGDGFEGSVRGRIRARELELETAGARLSGMHLDLPVALERSGPEDAPAWTGPESVGSFRLGPSTVGDVALPAIRSQLLVQADSLTLAEPLDVSLLGGNVRMGRFTLKDLARPTRYAETALTLTGLSLEAITAETGLPLEGRIDGELPKVTLDGRRLRVVGGGTLKLFGGEVEVRDVSGSEIFTPFPKIRLSAELRRIRLGELTRRFDFGEVTGVLSGRIDDCELFRGVPTSFRATFRSERERGVPQTVDVKAVKNLTILGTGQGGSVNIFDRGIQQFLSRYRYSALGVRVELENDVLLLEGLERRGEKELFLKGGFPFGIDIVNARPGQTVSFQTMVGRLQALDFDAAKID